MPTFLLLYSCNLFWCDTKFILNVQPPAEENSKPFLYSVGCSLYLHWWRTLMPTGCSLHGPSKGRRNNGPSTWRRNYGPYMGRRHNMPFMGRIINGPSTSLWS